MTRPDRLLALLPLLSCGPRTPATAPTGPSDARLYIESALTLNYPTARSDCGRIRDPSLVGKCFSDVARDHGVANRESVYRDCAALASKPWRSECFFSLAESVGLSGDWPNAAAICSRAEFYAESCRCHLLELRARALVDGLQTGEEPTVVRSGLAIRLIEHGTVPDALPGMMSSFDEFYATVFGSSSPGVRGVPARAEGNGAIPANAGSVTGPGVRGVPEEERSRWDRFFRVLFRRMDVVDRGVCDPLEPAARISCRENAEREEALRTTRVGADPPGEPRKIHEPQADAP